MVTRRVLALLCKFRFVVAGTATEQSLCALRSRARVSLLLPGVPPFSPRGCKVWLMRLPHRLSQPQKSVVVVALGMAFTAAISGRRPGPRLYLRAAFSGGRRPPGHIRRDDHGQATTAAPRSAGRSPVG